MFNAADVLQPSFIEQPLDRLWALISPYYAVDESEWLAQLIPLATPSLQEHLDMDQYATALIARVRADKNAIQMIDALLLEYSLDTKEGVLLMCLAEALMRIPDTATADALIRDKLSVADWKSHLKHSDSLFVNASTWGLMLTGKVVGLEISKDGSATDVINRLVNKMSEPVIRQAMHQAMKIMGHQFVLGRDITEAMKQFQCANALKYAAKHVLMPGPTGESNTLYCSGRGVFIVTAQEGITEEAIVGQLTAALVCGNSVLVCLVDTQYAERIVAQLEHVESLANVITVVSGSALDTLVQHSSTVGVAYCGDVQGAQQLARQLAQREGLLAQLVVELDGITLPIIGSQRYCLRFITERTRTINITAVGGNATLLALGSGDIG